MAAAESQLRLDEQFNSILLPDSIATEWVRVLSVNPRMSMGDAIEAAAVEMQSTRPSPGRRRAVITDGTALRRQPIPQPPAQKAARKDPKAA